MTIELIYWITIAGIGFAASIGSLGVGLSLYWYLLLNRPEVAKSFRSDLVRDLLLVIGLGMNVMVGIAAAVNLVHEWPVTQALTLIGVLGSSTILSLFAVLNFWLRVRYGNGRTARN